MNMTLGAEPKKVAILGALLLVAVVVFFINSSSEPEGYSPPTSPSGVSRPATTSPSPSAAAPPTASSAIAPNRAARQAEREFRPSPRPRRGEARPDPTTIDPTLRLDLLAKLQNIDVEGMRRSIFDFGQAPAPPKPEQVAGVKPKAPSPFIGPAPPPPKAVPPPPPAPPKAPPVPFKFYGFLSNQTKSAFFMEGEDIHVVREGDVVKNRYKIVRIGVNSVVVEDMQFKSEQTLPLEEQPT